ncbi:DEAD/DEAH box helicase [Hirsutella rhossiliensis]|uniref:RNA helicase n=1 Tax=Hirsutella rhossiliensis TaxID=111463 RepID=A0A9P8SMF6_9HYPO|nr:DEAD/DEAH box helicase domain-containing protein [Hirsutella rhossiliensis]KAH0966081.1 DEAD/DEAH box helicase domain-containing protein [Hirsutella rhossiliensis]
MAPQKRKTEDDDFVYTLSDDNEGREDPLGQEELPPQPPKKKTKTAAKAKPAKRSKKATQKASEGNDESQEGGKEDASEAPEGPWGRKDGDDGAIDSDFEFLIDQGGLGGDEEEEDFEGWGFEGAKKGISSNRKIVDVDDIIQRRRNKQKNDDDLDEDAVDVSMDDDDDQVLAEDAFGMNMSSDAEESGDEAKQQDEDDDSDSASASDDDSVATDDGEEDPEEQAKRDAFFAPDDGLGRSGQKGDPASTFMALSLSRPILRGLAAVGFTKPTPIQAKTIPIALMGRDVVGGAVTGSGKTGAFMIPILERLLYRPNKVPTTRVVVLTPTRELAMQCHAVAMKLASHTDIKFSLAVGGLSLKAQEAELRRRPDVVIATPGRFIDHMRNSASFNVDTVEILVLDEADRMLEDGFADELNEILNTLPKSRQTMLFSATMTSTVDRLIRVGMNKPVRLMVDAQKKTVGTLVQEFVRLRPGRDEKRMGYLVHLCKVLYTERVIIFFRQKKEAHRARVIFGLLDLSCAELHGSMNQTQRIQSVESFRDGKVSYLLATDLASRGLDIKGVDTVINYEAPQSLDIYVHRVGRTARAGRRGTAVTLAAEGDRKVVKAAVRAGKAQGAKIASRIIPPADADKWQDRVDDMEDEMKEIMQEEKEEKQLAHAEMQVMKGENLLEHEAEIKGRPKRTWFETQHDKEKAKLAGRAELNGVRESMKKKGGGKLSNKDKKKLDAKALRSDGDLWRKGKNSGAPAPGKGSKAGGGKPRAAPDYKKPNRSELQKDTWMLAPFRFFGLGPVRALRPHPRHTQSFARFLFPRAVRDRYRERLLSFHLDILPHIKHGVQSRIHRFIVRRQRRRADKGRVIDLVARHGRHLLLGPPRSRAAKDGRGPRPTTQMPTLAGLTTGYVPGVAADGSQETGERGERGYRRRKLAAMAGNLYRSGQQAVTDLRESYAQSRARGPDGEAAEPTGSPHIPGAFPDVAIVSNDDEQMVLFPSYAKRHERKHWYQATQADQSQVPEAGPAKDEEYWRQEWERHEDEKAIVDVDVRGWIYSPQVGPMTRRNRILIGLARQLSGISAPTRMQEEMRDQEKIAKEAALIEQRGQEEKRVAYSGGYSEQPPPDKGGPSVDAGGNTADSHAARLGEKRMPDSGAASPTLSARKGPSVHELSEAELILANANLMARVAPFLTYPLVAMPITIFFYNDTESQSRTVLTNDAGHFLVRAQLDFVPTHVRVLADERLSATQPVKVTEPHGVSLISDVDDTVKHSNISAGAREIFRNTFVRELAELTVDGVQECPWQLFPVLATFFKLGGLPPGSLHLKQYSGMLQGIFEPVAERKKTTLNRLMTDFPTRKFLLVGDSGEADLEVYTELALANPGRILAIFIRDVTTPPEKTGFFDSAALDLARHKTSSKTPDDEGSSSRASMIRRDSARGSVSGSDDSSRVSTKATGPAMGTLIDFSQEPEEIGVDKSAAIQADSRQKTSSTTDLPLERKKPPPPRPVKPAALRSRPSSTAEPSQAVGPGVDGSSPSTAATPPPPPPPPRTRKSAAGIEGGRLRPSSQLQRSSGTPKPPPPPPRSRAATPSSSRNLSPPLSVHRRGPSSNSDVDFDPLPPPSAPAPTSFGMSYFSSGPRSAETTPSDSPVLGAQVVNKKLDLWLRRLERAHEELDKQGVALYTWRKGQDVMVEAEAIVKEALEEMERAKGEAQRRR